MEIKKEIYFQNGHLTTSPNHTKTIGKVFSNFEIAVELFERGLTSKDPRVINWKDYRKNLVKKDKFIKLKTEMNANVVTEVVPNEYAHTAIFSVIDEKEAQPHIENAINAFVSGLTQLTPMTHKAIVVGYKIVDNA